MRNTIFKWFLIIGCTFLMYDTLFSQWFQLPSGTTNNLNDICFINSNTGFVVGNAGIIKKTTNGGLIWSLVQSPTAETLYKIIFKSTATGYICGENGVIAKTTDSGMNWILQPAGTNAGFRDIAFLDVNTGWAVGIIGIVRYTTNGGTNWLNEDLGISWSLTGISAVSQNRVFVCATGVPGAAVYLSTNAGGNWTQTYTYTNGQFTYLFNTICFIDNYTGYMGIGTHNIGYSVLLGGIWRTTNGGYNWVSVFSQAYSPIKDFYFVSSSIGTAVGEYGVIVRTTNGGLNWPTQFSGSYQYLNGAYFIDSDTGYVVGSVGTILKTTNGGNPLGIKQINSEIPRQFSLSQNYPNPFNPKTNIQFTVPLNKGGLRRLFVTLKIYDILGKEVAMLVKEQLKPGTYEVTWYGGDYPSGVYFYKLITEFFSETKKMILIK